MTDRERLIALLSEGGKIASEKVHKSIHDFVKEHHHFSSKEDADKVPSMQELVADYLLDNGVIVSPVKIGYPIDTPKPNNSLKRTNGDKIRSMTDEELAVHFNQMEKDVSDHMNAGGRWNIGESNVAFWIKWLGTPEGEDCE